MRQPDALDDLVLGFEPIPLRAPVFLNSVPKCGTHLLRNIVRMFVPPAQQYHADYIQLPILRQNLKAFDPAHPFASWGHLLFTDDSAIALNGVRQVVLVRDPYDYVLARARFFLADQVQHPLNAIKGGAASADQVISMMIFGVYDKAPSMNDVFQFNAAAWLGRGVRLARYEDIVANVARLETPEAEIYFAELLDACGIALPGDWRERVRVGSDRNHSRTAREHLDVGADLPEVLSDTQKRMVDYAAPGLRSLLGYA